MISWRKTIQCVLVIALLSVLSLSTTALRQIGGQSQTCSPRVDPNSGVGRVICTTDKVQPLYNTKPPTKPRDILTPIGKPPKIIGPTTYDKTHGITPTLRGQPTQTLSQRLCGSSRIPIAGHDPNPEGHVVRVIQCLPAGSIIGQESASFLPRKVQLSRWRQLRDPFPYTQKHNRAFILR